MQIVWYNIDASGSIHRDNKTESSDNDRQTHNLPFSYLTSVTLLTLEPTWKAVDSNTENFLC